VLRREPVVDADHHCLDRVGQADRAGVFGLEAADAESATVQVEDPGQRAGHTARPVDAQPNPVDDLVGSLDGILTRHRPAWQPLLEHRARGRDVVERVKGVRQQLDHRS
jgi:hypothetical protein